MIKIDGFLNKCDYILDYYDKVVYYLCYQNVRKFKGLTEVETEVQNQTKTSPLYFLLTINSPQVEQHRIEIYKEFDILLLGLGTILVIMGVGLMFANMVVGVILLVIGLIIMILGLRKRAQYVSFKKKVFYSSQYTPFLIRNPDVDFAIMDVAMKPQDVPKDWNPQERYSIPDIKDNYRPHKVIPFDGKDVFLNEFFEVETK